MLLRRSRERHHAGALRERLTRALRGGDELAPIARDIAAALLPTIVRRRGRFGTGRVPLPLDEQELRYLHAVVIMEQLSFDRSAHELERIPGHPMFSVLHARLAMLRGSDDHAPLEDEPMRHDLDRLLLDDTQVQRALVAGAHVDHDAELPVTSARLHAARGHDEACITSMAAMSASRRDAMCRALPQDRAVLLWHRRQEGRYR